jgi:DMSO/TMAO reductase YedYZ molybdopterin-dependent catalytic subunit
MPNARYLVYSSIEPDWWDSLDIEEALHPQTLLAWAMNAGDLPVAFGGPLRMRVPRQLGYKSVKFITRLRVTDTAKGFVPAFDPNSPNYGYSWYAGI